MTKKNTCGFVGPPDAPHVTGGCHAVGEQPLDKGEAIGVIGVLDVVGGQGGHWGHWVLDVVGGQGEAIGVIGVLDVVGGQDGDDA